MSTESPVRQSPSAPTAGADEPAPTAVRRDPVATATRTVIPYLLTVGTFIALARVAAMPLSNFDTYFHLRFGHEFLHGWSLRHPGSVSSFATQDWVPTQWLPQVVMAQTEEWLGLAGVAWLSGLQLVSLALTLYVVGRRFADPVVVAPLTVIALIADSPGLSMRPQVISYILTAVFAGIWLKARDTGRVPWVLIPLSWLWAMCHGMWPVGLLLGFAAVLGLALDRAVDRRTWAKMLAVPILSTLACGLTPVGPQLYAAVLLVNSRGKYFSEWDPPDFTEPITATLLLLLAVVVIAMLRRERNPWFDVLLLGMAVGWGVYSGRTVEASASIAVPLGCLVLQQAIRERTAPRRREWVLVLGAYAATLAVLAAVVPSVADKPPPQPAWVDARLSALPEGTAILGDSGFGGYLMWAFPNLDVVAHGYGDTYTTAELDRNVAIADLNGGWEQLVHETGAEYALLDPGSRLAYALNDLGWELLDVDREVELLRAPPDWNS